MGGGGAGGSFSPKFFKLPPVYSCDCTVVVIVLTCGPPLASCENLFFVLVVLPISD